VTFPDIPRDLFRLDGHVAIVTGGLGRLGSQYVRTLAAAGASVGLVAWLYEQGGFVTMLHAFAALCLLVIAAAIILPTEIKVSAAHAN